MLVLLLALVVGACGRATPTPTVTPAPISTAMPPTVTPTPIIPPATAVTVGGAPYTIRDTSVLCQATVPATFRDDGGSGGSATRRG